MIRQFIVHAGVQGTKQCPNFSRCVVQGLVYAESDDLNKTKGIIVMMSAFQRDCLGYWSLIVGPFGFAHGSVAAGGVTA